MKDLELINWKISKHPLKNLLEKIISKDIPDNLLDDILNKVKNLKLKYDDELNERVNNK